MSLLKSAANPARHYKRKLQPFQCQGCNSTQVRASGKGKLVLGTSSDREGGVQVGLLRTLRLHLLVLILSKLGLEL